MNSTVNRIFRPILEILPENNRLERIWVLGKVDFKKRYYHSTLGLFWALLNPLFRLCIYYVIFTVVFSSKIEYFALYLFAGLVFWMFFSEATKKSFQVIRSKKYLIENIQFNKVDLFYSSILGAFVGFLFNLLALILMYALSFKPISIYSLWFPFLTLNLVLIVFGVSLLLSVVHMYITDIHQFWDMVLFAGRFTCPIFIPVDIFYGSFAFMRFLNPVTGVIINLQKTLIFNTPPDYFLLVYDITYTTILVTIAIWTFRNYSHRALEVA